MTSFIEIAYRARVDKLYSYNRTPHIQTGPSTAGLYPPKSTNLLFVHS